jgi:hypothetical protein
LEAPEVVTPVDVTPAVLSALTGRYEFQNNNMMVLSEQSGRVYTYSEGLPDEEFVLASDGRFVSTERAVSFKLLRNASGDVEGIEWTWPNKTTRRVPRIGPLFTAIRPTADPDPAFTRNVLTIVHTFAAGGKETAESPLLTAGARSVFTAPANVLKGVRGCVRACKQCRGSRHRAAWSCDSARPALSNGYGGRRAVAARARRCEWIGGGLRRCG